jgi:hypothetical protein
MPDFETGSQKSEHRKLLERSVVWFALGMLLMGALAAVTFLAFLDGRIDARVKAFRDQGSLDERIDARIATAHDAGKFKGEPGPAWTPEAIERAILTILSTAGPESEFTKAVAEAVKVRPPAERAIRIINVGWGSYERDIETTAKLKNLCDGQIRCETIATREVLGGYYSSRDELTVLFNCSDFEQKEESFPYNGIVFLTCAEKAN